MIATYTQALRFAASLGTMVSVTAGLGETCFTSAQVTALNADELQHVTVVASSGDSGAAIVRCSASAPFTKGVNLPAADPLVLSVGGTELQADHTTGQYIGETVWNTPPPVLPAGVVASNGGFSSLFTRPAYQDGVPGTGAMRGVPDVAADADPATGPALAFEIDGGYAIVPGGGTSAGARSGPGSWPWRTSARDGPSDSSTPRSTRSAAAACITARSTTSPRVTTRSCSPAEPYCLAVMPARRTCRHRSPPVRRPTAAVRDGHDVA